MKRHYPANIALTPLTQHWKKLLTDYGTIEELSKRHPDVDPDWFAYEDDVYIPEMYSVDICRTDSGDEFALIEFYRTEFDHKYDWGDDEVEIVHINGIMTLDNNIAVGIELDSNSTYYRLWEIRS